ncbi:NAD-dependent deacylase [Vicingus serpentipes]|uniref:NAD-dependent protein deacylase n=2 Tax=Vicingus serpentipes TaxID=1926625 RepID=A0A5C6RYS2_9FLAO|nr:NAD-dependent deacylase [Vicingus serpentipes]
MKNIVVFSGAGISAESGLKTFRDTDGLWENHNIEDVATPEAWAKNPKLVLEFYNARRKQVLEAEPNEAHIAIPKLEKKFNVTVITQNIDNLHERAGSKNVIHLHGEILKSRSVLTGKTYHIKSTELNIGDYCEKKSQLRPHIVWFGEEVPKMTEAQAICKKAEILIIVGTSLSVYPAANLIDFTSKNCTIYLIDPKEVYTSKKDNIIIIKDLASKGLPPLVEKLLLQK